MCLAVVFFQTWNISSKARQCSSKKVVLSFALRRQKFLNWGLWARRWMWVSGVSIWERCKYVLSYDARLIDAMAKNQVSGSLFTQCFISKKSSRLLSAKYTKQTSESMPPALKSVLGFLLWNPMFTHSLVFKSSPISSLDLIQRSNKLRRTFSWVGSSSLYLPYVSCPNA